MYEKDVKTTFPPTNHLIVGLIGALTLFGASLSAAPLPLVSVTASPSTVDPEIQQPAQYTISLSAPASRDIGVVFYMSGTARLGVDYFLSGNFNGSGQIVIPAGQTFTTVTLTPRAGDTHAVRENALMNLVHDTRSVHTYALGFPFRADVIITIE